MPNPEAFAFVETSFPRVRVTITPVTGENGQAVDWTPPGQWEARVKFDVGSEGEVRIYSLEQFERGWRSWWPRIRARLSK